MMVAGLWTMTIYFDGSQGTDDNGTNWLTLAGLMAPEAVWRDFRWNWNQMLANRNPPAPYTHMCDLHTGNRPFDRAAGWNEAKANGLTNDAIQVIQETKFKHKEAIFAVGIRVDLDAHQKIVSQGLTIQSPSDICVFGSIPKMAHRFVDNNVGDSMETLNIVFDRGEKFLHPFKQEWDRNKTKGPVKKPLFWDLIVDVKAMDSKAEPGLQAADMFAWSYTRSLLSKERPWGLLSRFLLPRPGESGGLWPCATAAYDEPQLMDGVRRQAEKARLAQAEATSMTTGTE